MSNIYCIDDVLFYPEQRLLASRTDGENRIVLTTPASQCLEILIAQQPDIVSHEIFFREVWERRGMQIPHNTLYQNISQIRKALKSLSASKRNYITTVPRLGFKLTATILTIDNGDLPHGEAVEIIKDDALINAEISESATNDGGSKKLSIVISFGLAILLIITALFFFLILKYQRIPQINFSNYVFLEKKAQCEFYANKDFKKNSTSIDYIRKEKNRCNLFPYIYITAPPGAATISAMSCDKSLNNEIPKRTCVTFIYYGVSAK